MKKGPNATYKKIKKKQVSLLGESATSLQNVDIPKSVERLLMSKSALKEIRTSFQPNWPH